MKQLTDAARLVILACAVALILSIIAIVVLAALRLPIPSALEGIPIPTITGLLGLLGMTHPNTTAVVPDPTAAPNFKPLS